MALLQRNRLTPRYAPEPPECVNCGCNLVRSYNRVQPGKIKFFRDGSDTGLVLGSDVLSAAVATVVRAQPKDFKAARRALRTLKGVVRRQVRKQAVVMLRCMQALVRVQARVRAQRVRMSIEGQAVQNMLNERRTQAELFKQAEGWCDHRGTLQEVKAKIQMRQEGAFKHERALAYDLAQKVMNLYVLKIVK
ncbi:hypothetical protein M8C21_006326 [Ambrosia artemisiifolia]|uniref:Protein IQ-DOMAIN 1-like n=1 Tax=Ambrosia artemisiifolia TaxID=4212 RepID=A0AAD5CGC8_AMBAR|nr:hypothetical protein M8C21_006326 [Ambrosia artemisiifolia]